MYSLRPWKQLLTHASPATGTSHGDKDGFKEHGGPLSGDSGEIDFRKHSHSFRRHRLGRRSQDGVVGERVLRAEMFVLALRR